MNMNAELLSKLYAPLNIAVFKKTDVDQYQLFSDAPSWLTYLMDEKALQLPFSFEEQFFFSEVFLEDFEGHWKKNNGDLLVSDIWIEKSQSGLEIPLEASATRLEGKSFIFIQHVGHKYREITDQLQTARDNALVK